MSKCIKLSSSVRWHVNFNETTLNESCVIFKRILDTKSATIDNKTFENCILSTIDSAVKLNLLIDYCEKRYPDAIEDKFYFALLLDCVVKGRVDLLEIILRHRYLDLSCSDSKGNTPLSVTELITNPVDKQRMVTYISSTIESSELAKAYDKEISEKILRKNRLEGLEAKSSSSKSFTSREVTRRSHSASAVKPRSLGRPARFEDSVVKQCGIARPTALKPKPVVPMLDFSNISPEFTSKKVRSLKIKKKERKEPGYLKPTASSQAKGVGMAI